MNVLLMHPDRDFDLAQNLPWNAQNLVEDLDLNTLFNTMAQKDQWLFDVARTSVLSSLTDPNTIQYRQHILQDCLKNPSTIRNLYGIATESMQEERKIYFGIFNSPSSVLYWSVQVLELFVRMLKKLANIAREEAEKFESEGFAQFFAMLIKEFDDEYFASLNTRLNDLRFPNGMLVSAELGDGNRGTHYILRRPHDVHTGWIHRLLAAKSLTYTYSISDRDESGDRALSALRDQGLNLVANAAAQSADHILGFFTLLRTELAFYLGCVNLHEQLTDRALTACFPLPSGPEQRCHHFNELYDLCLALRAEPAPVGNDMCAENKELIVITGANQGGKSTFLRSIGIAQLMMQCGMFVPAASFCANVCDHVLTHYSRREDTAMNSGKLDEELTRISEIVDHITPRSLLLLNESFAATNEREGSEIARQILSAFMDMHIKVFFVTHLYEFAQDFYSQGRDTVLFLRAQRQEGGERTYKILEGAPLQTSYGADLYHRIFVGTAGHGTGGS